MPELPEIEVLRRSLEPHLLGDRIERVEVRNPALREPVATARLRRDVQGRAVIALRRRSKYLLIDLEAGRTIAVHLGMS
jgi:formamidopyrimidine-DNA glycosylase